MKLWPLMRDDVFGALVPPRSSWTSTRRAELEDEVAALADSEIEPVLGAIYGPAVVRLTQKWHWHLRRIAFAEIDESTCDRVANVLLAIRREHRPASTAAKASLEQTQAMVDGPSPAPSPAPSPTAAAAAARGDDSNDNEGSGASCEDVAVVPPAKSTTTPCTERRSDEADGHVAPSPLAPRNLAEALETDEAEDVALPLGAPMVDARGGFPEAASDDESAGTIQTELAQLDSDDDDGEDSMPDRAKNISVALLREVATASLRDAMEVEFFSQMAADALDEDEPPETTPAPDEDEPAEASPPRNCRRCRSRGCDRCGGTKRKRQTERRGPAWSDPQIELPERKRLWLKDGPWDAKHLITNRDWLHGHHIAVRGDFWRDIDPSHTGTLFKCEISASLYVKHWRWSGPGAKLRNAESANFVYKITCAGNEYVCAATDLAKYIATNGIDPPDFLFA